MSNNSDVKERIKKKTGPKPKPEAEQCQLGRMMVNLPPVFCVELRRVADSNGLKIAQALRQAAYQWVAKYKKAA